MSQYYAIWCQRPLKVVRACPVETISVTAPFRVFAHYREMTDTSGVVAATEAVIYLRSARFDPSRRHTVRRMKSVIKQLFLVIIGVAMMSNAVADDETTERDATSNEKVIDEIEVIGQRTPRQLQKIVIEARLDFWAMYNTLNDNPDYRMTCERVAKSRSNFKELRCVPGYFTDRLAQMTQERSLRRGPKGEIQMRAPPPSERMVIAETREQKRAADAHMIALIESNPQLRDKYDELVRANEAYERGQERD
ncbi:MAG: hypothetical protein AAF265_09720 [Pseudomonadota bacterium]